MTHSSSHSEFSDVSKEIQFGSVDMSFKEGTAQKFCESFRMMEIYIMSTHIAPADIFRFVMEMTERALLQGLPLEAEKGFILRLFQYTSISNMSRRIYELWDKSYISSPTFLTQKPFLLFLLLGRLVYDFERINTFVPALV